VKCDPYIKYGLKEIYKINNMIKIKVCLSENCLEQEIIYINKELKQEDILKLICTKFGFEGWIGYEIIKE
jgi:hypothetical protein